MTVLSLLSFPFRLIRRFATLFAVLALMASLTFNVAVLTVSGVYAAASTALNAVGLTTVAAREVGAQLAQQRQATARTVRATTAKVKRRVQRGAARNIASVAGEAVPVVGVAVIAGALAMEVRDACDTARDMAALEAALLTDGDPEAASAAATAQFDCAAMIRAELPGYETLPTPQEIWQKAASAPATAYNEARAFGVELAALDWRAEMGKVGQTLVTWVRSQLPGVNYLDFWPGAEKNTP
jgi:hypothetical protein